MYNVGGWNQEKKLNSWDQYITQHKKNFKKYKAQFLKQPNTEG
jgi:hypothetical protein